jgi:NAD(P)-dependent dehydrogenase (short-subunit alcohol dehydrogenase family)
MDTKSAIHSDYLREMNLEHEDAIIDMPADRRAWVIGSDRTLGIKDSGRNIGAAIAQSLEQSHFKVFDYNKDDFDATESGTWQQMFDVYTPPDTLIICCGYTWLDWIENMPISEVFQIINDSLMAPIIATQEFVKATIDEPWRKHIVYVGSMAYRNVLNASSVYCAAKAGLAHYARCAAWELAPKGYDVFAVHPSNTLDTPMTDKTINDIRRYRGITDEEAEAYWESIAPKGRFLTKNEIALTVRMLVAGSMTFASGSQVELSGGAR